MIEQHESKGMDELFVYESSLLIFPFICDTLDRCLPCNCDLLDNMQGHPTISTACKEKRRMDEESVGSLAARSSSFHLSPSPSPYTIDKKTDTRRREVQTIN